ncbi:DUF4250 domain-containing protein [[Ruminococcus] torques]|jgi:hypothetical protein|uniref:DUF4250 domain-containing protein n=1 Tax=[Ruminococcus] torques TaxID=33039 RepID=UPI001F986D75|nr:DUF4250 domain-containing protein [[Ruminococcus] torques]MBS5398616.1 DUF4250 domain-containing protein [Lachnospiraceae bacterium]MDM8236419.1 DUF4250 domain-containing protein [[Ruminococcus] torques]HJC80606.1 DUF4250 domain-containing protein [Candidatus Mediterraneibacter excrementipullorum]
MLAGLPGDPVILLGVVNTKLRDFYPSLEALCDDLEIDRDELSEKLDAIDYTYDAERNQFV